MTDQELIEYMETKVIREMLEGCEMDDHLRHKNYDVNSWSVSFRADMLSRLIDLAKGKA
jgi:hypothetical protein